MSTRLADVLLIEAHGAPHPHTPTVTRAADLPGRLHVVPGCKDALLFLRRMPPYDEAPRPDLILLELYHPSAGDWAVLQSVKTDPLLRSIPVLVLLTAGADADVRRAYDLGANSCITKPTDEAAFADALRTLYAFWSGVVQLPPKG